MRQYETFELTFTEKEPQGSQSQINLKAVFEIGETRTQVDGFYAGNGQYKVRFYPVETGVYHWTVTGKIQAAGEEKCEPAKQHGMVHAAGLHFNYEDGTAFYPFGTTVYALVHQSKELIHTTMQSLQKAPFNKVRFCLFPKHYDYNHNEPVHYAFEKTAGRWDVHKPCFAFWDALENRIRELGQMGIEGDLILFHPYDRWGFSTMGMEDNLVYLDYLLRRLSAFSNIWWSMANEYDLMKNYSWQEWEQMTRFVAEHDPYHHLLSNHNCFGYWDFTQKEITHCCIQDVCVEQVPELQEKYKKPIIFDECRYEGNIQYSWGNLSAMEMTQKFWTAAVLGGYCTHGETFYSEDEVLWWSKGGILKGKSPERIAFLRELMEALPGPLTLAKSETVAELTVEKVEEMKLHGVPEKWQTDFFATNLIHMPREQIGPFIRRHRPMCGHCGKDAYLRYYMRECTSFGELFLPEDRKYTIEVIDTWEMTRKKIMTGVSGHVIVPMPGREYMAVLAQAEK